MTGTDTVRRILLNDLRQSGYPVGALPQFQIAVRQCCDAGGIVAAILEALERIDHQGSDRLASHYADDPTHVRVVPSLAPC